MACAAFFTQQIFALLRVDENGCTWLQVLKIRFKITFNTFNFLFTKKTNKYYKQVVDIFAVFWLKMLACMQHEKLLKSHTSDFCLSVMVMPQTSKDSSPFHTVNATGNVVCLLHSMNNSLAAGGRSLWKIFCWSPARESGNTRSVLPQSSNEKY